MTQSTGSKAKLWLVETSPSDPDSKKYTERMGMTVTEFAANMGYADTEFRSKTGRTDRVWPKHTMREIRDPAEIVYQYGISDNSWSLRYKALGCHEPPPPPLHLLRHRDNPKFSENSALFPQLVEPCATAPARTLNIPSDALLTRTDQQPVADDITSEQRDRLLEDLRLSDSDDEGTKTAKPAAVPEHLQSLKTPVADAPQTAKSNPPVNNHRGSAATLGLPARIPNPSIPHQNVQGVVSTDLLGKNIILPTKPDLVSPLRMESPCNPTTPTTTRLKPRGPEDSGVSPSASRSVDLSGSRLPLPDSKQSAAANLKTSSGKLVSPPTVKVLNSSSAAVGTIINCKQRTNRTLVDSAQEQSNKENLLHSASVGDGISNDDAEVNCRSPPPRPPSPDEEKRTSSATTATSRAYVRQVLAKADAILDLRQHLIPSICAESLSFTDDDSDLQLEGGELDTAQQPDTNDLGVSKPSLKGSGLRRKLPFGPRISPLPQSPPRNGEVQPSYSSPRLKAATAAEPPQNSRTQIDSRVVPSPLPVEDIPSSQTSVPSVDRRRPSRVGSGSRNHHRHSALSFNKETSAKSASESSSQNSDHTEPDSRACVSSTAESKRPPLSPKAQEKGDGSLSQKPSSSSQRDNKMGNESSPIAPTATATTLSMPPPRSKRTRSERSSSSSSTVAPPEAPAAPAVADEAAVAVAVKQTPTAATVVPDSPSLRALPPAPWVLSSPLPSTDICSRLPWMLSQSARSRAASYEDKLSALRFVMRNLRLSSANAVGSATANTTPTVRPLTAVLLIPPTHPLDPTTTGHSTEVATATSPSLLPPSPAPVIVPEVSEAAVQSAALTTTSYSQVSPRPFTCASTCTSPSLEVQKAMPEVAELGVGTSPFLFSHATAVCASKESLSLEDCLHRVLKHNQESIEATRRSFLQSTAEKQLNEAEQLKGEAAQCWSNLADFVAATHPRTRTSNSSAAAVTTDKDLTKQFVCRCGDGAKTLLHYLFRLRDFTGYPDKMLSSVRHFIAAANLMEKTASFSTAIDQQKDSSAAAVISNGFAAAKATAAAADGPRTPTGIYNEVVKYLRTTASRLKRAEAKLLRRARTAAARIAAELPNLPATPGPSSPGQAGVSSLVAPEWSNLWYSALPRIASVLCYKEYQLNLPRTNTLREKIEADELLQSLSLDDDFLADSPASSPLHAATDGNTLYHDSSGTNLCRLPVSTVRRLLKFYRVATLAHESVLSRAESETYLVTDQYSIFSVASGDSASPAAAISSPPYAPTDPPVFVAPSADITSLLAYIDGVLRQSRDIVARLSYCPEALAESASAIPTSPPLPAAKRKRAAPSSDQSEPLAQSPPPPPPSSRHHKRRKSKKPHSPRPAVSPTADLPPTVILPLQESVRKHKRFKSPSFSSSQPSAESVVSSSPIRSPPAAVVPLKSGVPSAEEAAAVAATVPRKSKSLKKMRVSEEASEETDYASARDPLETSLDYQEPRRIKRSKKDREASVSSVETEQRQRSQALHERASIDRMSDHSPQRSLTGGRMGSENGTFKASHQGHRSRSRSRVRDSRPLSKDDRMLSSPRKSEDKYASAVAGNNAGGSRKHREKSLSRNHPGSKTDRDLAPLPLPPSAQRYHRTLQGDPPGSNHEAVAEKTSAALEGQTSLGDDSRLTYSPTRPYLSSNEASVTAAYRVTSVAPADRQYIPSAPKVDPPPASQAGGRRTLLPGLPPKAPTTTKSQTPSFYAKWLDGDGGDSKNRSIPTSHRSSIQRPHR